MSNGKRAGLPNNDSIEKTATSAKKKVTGAPGGDNE